ncbi:hypothetical protein F5Y10DRAFT_238106 [Nemania abortiva]|nr:hypothetical protein F5Y10DRAFT_238106 [Nemania abortiva]
MRLTTSIFAISLLGVALADCGVEGGTIIVANPNYDIMDELDACSTIFGDILLDPAFVYFMLRGPQEITGTIIAHDNVILKSLSLADVRKLGGFSFASPTIETVISFPEVTEIGFLEWRNITWDYEFSHFTWQAEKLVTVSNLNIEATYISGFMPDYPTYDGTSFYYGGLTQLEMANTIRVVDNQRMDEVVFQSLKEMSGSLIVGSNYNFLNSRGKRDGTSLLVSLPELVLVGGSVVIYDDDVIRGSQEGKIDLPALDHVFGDFNVTNIGGISEISVPTLGEINRGLYILGNKGLKSLDFPELRRVDHVVIDGGDSYYGGFETISFPVLEEVGSFHVNAPAYNFDCSSLEHIRQIASEFSCSNSRGTYDPDAPSSTSEVPPPSPTDPESSPTATTDEPSATSGSMETDQPSQTNSPATTVPADSTSSPNATSDAGATPTNESPADASGSAPASSGASGPESPIVAVLLLFTYWLL